MPRKSAVTRKPETVDLKNQHFCVKFNNYMNTIPLQAFTAQDYNFFMTICALIKGRGTDKVVITFKELREMTGFHETETEELIHALEQVFKKMAGIICNVNSERYVYGFTLFNSYGIDRHNKKIVVAANPDFAFILNRYLDGFTWFELKDFLDLRSKYDKALYRLLCQYRSTGLYVVKVDTFRQLMCFPSVMPNKKMVQQLKSSVAALQNLLPGLACEAIKSCKRNVGIVSLKFTFQKSKAEPAQEVLTVNPDLVNNKPEDGLTMNELAELAELKSQHLDELSARNATIQFVDTADHADHPPLGAGDTGESGYDGVDGEDDEDPFEVLLKSDAL